MLFCVSLVLLTRPCLAQPALKGFVSIKGGTFSSGDMVAAFWSPRYFSSLQEAQQEVGCGWEGFGLGVPRQSRLDYTLYLFPQPAGMDCPVSNPAYLP